MQSATVLWVDVDGYVGPDRRNRSQLRLIERRRVNAARPPPSIAALLRQLHMLTLDVRLGDEATLAKCRARIAAIAALARTQGESGAAGWLDALGERLRRATSGARNDAGDIIAQHVQRAMAALH